MGRLAVFLVDPLFGVPPLWTQKGNQKQPVRLSFGEHVPYLGKRTPSVQVGQELLSELEKLELLLDPKAPLPKRIGRMHGLGT